MSPLSYLSLGWGVQSTTLAAMMALDEIPRVDYIIHADTTHEKEATYEYAERMTPWFGEHGIDIVTLEGTRTEIIRHEWGIGAVMIPAFSTDKADGSHGQITRQCTGEWKIKPIRRFISAELKRLGRKKRPGAVVAYMGISLDEARRMRDSDVKYVANRYPLVERYITRQMCMNWLIEHDIPVPPKSACSFCPYQSLENWRNLKRAGGSDWKVVQGADKTVRDMRDLHTLYLHPHRKPLAEAIELPEDAGQIAMEIDLEHPCDSGVCFT